MHVFYEEDGDFKVGSILTDNDSSLQVEAIHGKRSKIKSANVLLRFAQPSAAEFMARAQQLAAEVDIDFLWQVSSQNEFGFTELAKDYYGHEPVAAESAALLMRLHGAPMYFYKRGKGRYKAAPEENLKAALAGQERKRKQEELKGRYAGELQQRKLPPEFAPVINQLLFKPDKNNVEYKALDEAAHASRISVAQLLLECGALGSHHDYFLQRFLFEHFPHGTALPQSVPLDVAIDLPLAAVQAFSIDDATTTEIDDAFSVAAQGSGWRIGIHIAAPALGIAADTPLDRIARERLSTVYFPGDKITMLPDAAIDAFTLARESDCAVLSLYLNIDGEYAVTGCETRIERVHIAANLHHGALDAAFTLAALERGQVDHRYARELQVLWRIASKLEAARGKPQPEGKVDYSFYVDDDRVRIVPRLRGAPIDKVVAELMIFANAQWGKALAESGYGAIYRVQINNKTSMGVKPLPHEGLGVKQYAWSSSPLRRYVDLVNQRQLIALTRAEAPAYPADGQELLTIATAFEQTYDSYAEFQRSLERYWCLRYLEQEGIRRAPATLLRENLARFDNLPLVVKLPSHPAAGPGSAVTVEIESIDYWNLELAGKIALAAS